MRRAVLGFAVIVAVVVGCLLTARPAAADPPVILVLRTCPSSFAKGLAGPDADKDRNGDGIVCRKIISKILLIKLIIVIDNNVPARLKKKIKK